MQKRGQIGHKLSATASGFSISREEHNEGKTGEKSQDDMIIAFSVDAKRGERGREHGDCFLIGYPGNIPLQMSRRAKLVNQGDQKNLFLSERTRGVRSSKFFRKKSLRQGRKLVKRGPYIIITAKSLTE